MQKNHAYVRSDLLVGRLGSNVLVFLMRVYLWVDRLLPRQPKNRSPLLALKLLVQSIANYTS